MWIDCCAQSRDGAALFADERDARVAGRGPSRRHEARHQRDREQRDGRAENDGTSVGATPNSSERMSQAAPMDSTRPMASPAAVAASP